ncbi:TonB-dependent receptor [Sphingobium sp. TKS]|uniref:TonB-dependent receptor n=1 Tax=Sphingobium sp. TKS TaxID=1315974 RepID=UPI00076FFBD0|nr:TonB-dependent receptor [Sphingobium sp. TKS]AMK25814.1 TonB-dependent receptor-like protein [Sphingobium sp. TKS]
MGFGKTGFLIGAATALVAISPHVLAQDSEKRSYDLPAQDLKYALRAVARKDGYQLIADSRALRGKQAKALKGAYTVSEAVSLLVEGSDLIAEVRNGSIFVRGRGEPSREAINGTAENNIIVTGSRIRGGASASPVMTRTQDDIRTAGLSNLGDFARSLPQSFAGGQNPGVTVGVGGISNENVSSASSLNLRGLGPDATLTLLNGRRIAYNGVAQAIDISSIPLGAVDRVEIITDGASAVYGSDAVAGVANIILKRSYDGMEASARLGAATDGGDEQQQYSVVAGKTGRNLGFMFTYSYDRSTAIKAGDRSFTNNAFPNTTILPAMRQHSIVATGYWEPTDHLTISTDALFSNRHSITIQPLISNDYRDRGYRRTPRNQSWSISPKIEWKLPADWLATFMGTAAQDKLEINSRLYTAGLLNFASVGSYTNKSRILEMNLEGALVDLPAGDLRLALGGGYRSNRLIADLQTERATGTTPTVQFSKNRSSYYLFGEAAIPIVAPEQDIDFIHALSLSAAARYESYSGGMGHVTTPKLGLVYAPSKDINLKFSWGRSFKTPTLYQQFLDYTAQLVPISDFGGSAYPASATALYISGGNADLRPERATTMAATFEIHPAALPGLKMSTSLFHIRYKNRIATPIASTTGLLSNPAYQSLVNLSPTEALIEAFISGSPTGLTNLTDAPFNIDNVAAIVDSRYVNIAQQTAKGIDLDISYSVRLAAGDMIHLTGNLTYLESRRKVTPVSAAVDTAGTLFFPPHWRARGGADWSHGGFSLGIFGNYIGGIKDQRLMAASSIDGMTTVDMSARYRTSDDSGILNGIEISAAALNIFNDKPDRIQTTARYYPTFDSTNYSAMGRFISLTVTKRFQ